eukprot:TRINITY_DN1929_c0_g1_i2.p1 TRINITY_DN1929_c0_g1~~TRINITY_DN1929_c0_g1_i2.p1  ORF type:complete len:370 (+),score=31.68 TRINITY_DN1929_c0_g1_i2:48-1157(+)
MLFPDYIQSLILEVCSWIKEWLAPRTEPSSLLPSRRSRPSQPVALPLPPQNKPFRLLCLDGHGTSILHHAILLERLYQQNPNFMDAFDCIAGSSTGAITALLLATGYSPPEIVQLYQNALPRCTSHFPFNWRAYVPFVPALSSQPKLDFLQYVLGRTETLAHLTKYVIISSFDLQGDSFESETSPCLTAANGTDKEVRHWQPTLFTNLPQAAPLYNAIYQGHVDGSIWASNPTVAAVSRLLAAFPGRVCLGDIHALSLGGPETDEFKFDPKLQWGLMQWAPQLFFLLFNATHIALNNTARQLLGNRYLRVIPKPTNFRLDLLDSAEPFIRQARAHDLTDVQAFISKLSELSTPASPVKLRTQPVQLVTS